MHEGTTTRDDHATIRCTACRSRDCQLLTSRQIADVLQVSVASIYSMRCRGQVPAPIYLWRSGQRRGSPRWRACVLQAWLAATSVESR